MNEHRVVITGLGAVTPIGIGVKDFLDGLKDLLNDGMGLLAEKKSETQT